jgi:hypothetical protein
MDIAIEFNPSAFKHGVTETDIRCAFNTVSTMVGLTLAKGGTKANICLSALTATQITSKFCTMLLMKILSEYFTP